MYNGFQITDRNSGLAPHIRFETRMREDRIASLEQGHKVYVDEDWVIVTPRGGRDSTENTVKQWFSNISDSAQRGQYPDEWVKAFKQAYTAFKEGREMPVVGTPLRALTSLFSPAEVENCASLHVRTLEELAQANEETIGRLGMMGRELKQRAEQAVKLNEGKEDALKIAALQTDLKTKNDRIDELEKLIRDMQVQLSQLNQDGPRRGRPPKE